MSYFPSVQWVLKATISSFTYKEIYQIELPLYHIIMQNMYPSTSASFHIILVVVVI